MAVSGNAGMNPGGGANGANGANGAGGAVAGEEVLRLADVRKRFGGIVALEGVSLTLKSGEITALVGDNGAGKSTLIKIIAGLYAADEGEILLEGRPADFAHAGAARDHGVEVVHQDLALAERQSVYMNLFLGREAVRGPWRRLDKRFMARESAELLAGLDVRVPSVKIAVRNLSGGQRQGVAIARAARWARRLILLDEPTAALGVAETAKVESLIAGLRERRLAVLIVSHDLGQVFRLADRICVLRRGVQAGVYDKADVSENEIVAQITGAS